MDKGRRRILEWIKKARKLEWIKEGEGNEVKKGRRRILEWTQRGEGNLSG